MIQVGIVGATGYTGKKLISILLNHHRVKISGLWALLDKNTPYSEIFKEFKGRLDILCKKPDLKEILEKDFIFLCLPHKVSLKYVPEILRKKKPVIDLSADYRLKDPKLYEKYYTKHTDTKNLKKAVYGLPEFFRDKIKKAMLVANPGCYPTAVLLGVLPVLKFKLTDSDIIVDAKSGVTGAGRKPNLELSFCEVNENLKCYKPLIHQHAPEIESIATQITKSKIKIHFSPHLVPINRGILTTIYIKTKPKVAEKDISKAFEIYKNEKFVRVYFDGYLPQIRDVYDTNFCDIGFRFFKKERLLILVTCIDNLMKGASGQAVQNMNIMLGFKEDEGFKN